MLADVSVGRAIRRAGQGVVAGVLVLTFTGSQTACGSHPREAPTRRSASEVAPRDLEPHVKVALVREFGSSWQPASRRELERLGSVPKGKVF